MKNIILLFLCTVSCTRFSPEIEAVLQQAGNNRSELEHVLAHYGRHPEDSLKLRAAEFLIANMSGKYSEYYDAPWNDVATVFLRWTSSSDKLPVLKAYGLSEPVKREDVRYITAEYLINNIEMAFKVWREQPWGKHIPFDVFCEEILPYRLDVEPLENWREKALASFADLNKSFKKDSTITAVEACRRLNGLLPRFRLDNDFPPMNYSQLMATSKGSCDAMATLAVFSMRALGIPVTFDFTYFWPNRHYGHGWNSVCDSAGKHISFMGCETNPGDSHLATTALMSKVFRKSFSKKTVQTPVQMDEKYVPPVFRGNIIDVSHEYEGFYDVDIPVKYLPDTLTGYAYLADKRGSQWDIVAWGVTDGTTIRYGSIGRHVLYRPVWYENGILKPAGDTFVLGGDGCYAVVSDRLQPFKGPHILSATAPCIIPMRNFDLGGEGVAFHETDEHNNNSEEDDYRRNHDDWNSFSVDVEKGMNIGWVAPGEWLVYTVEVRDSGEYRLSASASSTTTGAFHLEIDGQNVSGSVWVPNTGGWYNWVWCPAEPPRVHLTEGVHRIKCCIETGGYNLHELKFSPSD
ncbi:MAG: carbohydrate-binding protein [Bacteroidales bacterium]|jgi:hypothetical protein|nr:carbohydrate-binding protein [Bacteroidales bacterium]